MGQIEDHYRAKAATQHAAQTATFTAALAQACELRPKVLAQYTSNPPASGSLMELNGQTLATWGIGNVDLNDEVYHTVCLTSDGQIVIVKGGYDPPEVIELVHLTNTYYNRSLVHVLNREFTRILTPPKRPRRRLPWR